MEHDINVWPHRQVLLSKRFRGSPTIPQFWVVQYFNTVLSQRSAHLPSDNCRVTAARWNMQTIVLRNPRVMSTQTSGLHYSREALTLWVPTTRNVNPLHLALFLTALICVLHHATTELSQMKTNAQISVRQPFSYTSTLSSDTLIESLSSTALFSTKININNYAQTEYFVTLYIH